MEEYQAYLNFYKEIKETTDIKILEALLNKAIADIGFYRTNIEICESIKTIIEKRMEDI